MGGSQSSVPPGREGFHAGASHPDVLCCDHRKNFRRKREDVKTKGPGSSQQSVNTNDTFPNQGSDGAQVPLFNKSSPSQIQQFDQQEINNRRDSQGGSVPRWLRDPEPLPDWTLQQQKVLIAQLDDTPLSRKHQEHLRRAMEKTHRLIPEKSIEEIERCYKHLQLKRIAYFGPDKANSRQSPPTGRTYLNYP